MNAHKRDSKSILLLLGHDSINEWPNKTIYKTNLTMWNTNLTKVVEKEFNNKWNEFNTQACLYYGHPGGLKKNPLAIARALKIAWDEGCKLKEIIKLVNGIVAFVKKEN